MSFSGLEYEKWQMDRFIDSNFIILRGPRLSGKSYFVREYFRESGKLYMIIDAFEAWMEKDSWAHRAIVEDAKKSFSIGKPVGSVIEYNILPMWEFDNFYDLFMSLPDGTYVIIDHAEYLHRVRKDDVDVLTVFQEFIDKGMFHFVFVPRSTTRLIEFLGPNNPKSPLFSRYEKYVDVVTLSPSESVRFINDKCKDVDYNVYKITGGLRGALTLYMESGCDRQSFEERIRKIVIRDLMPKGKKMGRKLVELFDIISKETRIHGYAEKEQLVNKYGFQRNHVDDFIEKLLTMGYVEYLDKNMIKTVEPFAFFNK